jgi:RNA polymerase sigma-70 factor (ECF subfamily)
MSHEPDRSSQRGAQSHFEQTILPHLDAAYNLARWIMSNDQDAEDMVQEAYLRAYQYFSGFHGDNSRAWLLTIVRNTCYTWLKENRSLSVMVDLDEEMLDGDADTIDPESVLQRASSLQLIRQALEKLPVEFRELIVLREFEEMSYKEIASITGIPMGTVMSRLARARQQIKRCLAKTQHQEGRYEL